MVGKLNRLPVDTQEALKQFACMGNSAEFDMLAMAYEKSIEELHQHLWEAVRTGLIFRSDDSYRFLHDRVQEAAYSMIPQQLRSAAHLRIGMLLAAHTPVGETRRGHIRDRQPTQPRLSPAHLRGRPRARRRAESHCRPARQGLDRIRFGTQISRGRPSAADGRDMGAKLFPHLLDRVSDGRVRATDRRQGCCRESTLAVAAAREQSARFLRSHALATHPVHHVGSV